MPAYMGGIIAFCIFLSFLIGLFSGYIMFHKDKDERYYAGYNDGFDSAYKFKELDKAIADAKDYHIAIVPHRIVDI